MDRNLLLAFALSFLVLSLWTMFQESQQPPPPHAKTSEGTAGDEAAARPEAPETAVVEPSGETGGVPALPPPPPGSAPPPSADPAPRPLAAEAPLEEGEVVLFESDLVHAEIDTAGAGLRHWELRRYDLGPKHGNAPVELTTGGRSLLTPFEELDVGDLSRAIFSLDQPDANTFAFHFTRAGVTVRKTYSFEAETYAFRLRIDVENGTQRDLGPRFALTWSASEADTPDFVEQALVALHDGSVERELLQGLGRGGFLGSLTGGAPQTVYDYPGDVDWAGVQTTYFLSAALPDAPTQASARFAALEPGKSGVAQIFFAPVQLPPGRSASREYRVYLGPKEPERLEALGAGTLRSIDLGWSWIAPMTRFFNWLLGVLHAIVPNYGLAIIILTVLVRVVTAPLTTKQMRSMERMRELQPKLKDLQEKYADDRQKQSEETMRLYRSEGVNPLGGCLPMVLQLPVMVGLFYALRSSIQLRQAPFVGWIDDLSAPETLFVIPGLELPVRVLPLAMGATMVLQQRMTPMNIDPTQARMMMTVMPIMMTFLFYQFASGLVLYWMVGNVLAIAHQLLIRRRQARQAVKE